MAQAWRQLPYVRLPGDELQRGSSRLDYLLWSDVVLDIQDGQPSAGS